VTPGEILPSQGALVLNAHKIAITVEVENTGDRPVQVGSHYHFFEVNNALRFERQKAYGQRLDIASGTAVRFEPGEKREVQLIPFGGNRVAYGFRGQVNGKL
jgi:urease subunit beta